MAAFSSAEQASTTTAGALPADPPSSSSSPADENGGSHQIEDANRKGLLQLFMALASTGGFAFLTGVIIYEGSYCTALSASLFLWAFCALLILLLSFCMTDLTVPLFLCCCLFDILLTLVTLTDCNPRDMYHWFLCIPVLMLYARGVGSCAAAFVAIVVQTTLLRYVAEVLHPFPTTCGFRHTLIGAAMSDVWLWSLLLSFSAGNHMSRTLALKRLQLALDDRERANAKLQQATKAKTDFLANMSHELRTPMHGIIAMSRELQDMLPPQTKSSHAITIISHCADHLLALVNDILDFERIESNQLEMEQIPFSVVSETHKVIDMVRVPAGKKHLTLSTDISVQHPLRVGDPVRFRQILFNLLSNSCKFTPEHGSVSLRLTEESADGLELAVTDSGIGITKEHLPRLFSSFSQVDASVNRRYGGSGLGLAITKRLCEAMGGSISCLSEPGKGSTFTVRVRLPVVQESEDDPERPGFQAVSSSAQSQLTPEDDPSKLRFNGLEVLLVEDNVVNQKVGKRMLHTLGCNVTVVENGVECLKALEEKEYPVILMDCQMPVMDGFQATRHIREREKSRREDEPRRASSGDDDLHAVKRKLTEAAAGDKPGTTVVREAHQAGVPIIALTASATKEYGAKCLEVGMSDVLFKPLRREALALALKKWIPPTPPAERQPSPPPPAPMTPRRLQLQVHRSSSQPTTLVEQLAAPSPRPLLGRKEST